MPGATYRQAIREFIRKNAQPPDKFDHQPRLYALACVLAVGRLVDDDVLYAAAWLHDLGVFIGHRPQTAAELACWDHVAYAIREVPGLLAQFAFPRDKVSAVLETISTHLPSRKPTSPEGTILRDADILEQLGAIGIVRALSKVGRDTRYPTHAEALEYLKRNARDLPQQLILPEARELAKPRIATMHAFFASYASEPGEGAAPH